MNEEKKPLEQNKTIGSKKNPDIQTAKKAAKTIAIFLYSFFLFLIIFLVIQEYLSLPHYPSYYSSPLKGASQILKNAYNTPLMVSIAKKVTFSTGYSNLNALAIENNSGVGITREQICLRTGDFSDSPLFVNDNTNAIVYSGSSRRDVGLIAFCSTVENLQEDFRSSASELVYGDWDLSECCQGLAEQETCCVVGLITAKQ